MEKYTTDASVILKWVLGDKAEADQKKAMALLTGWVEGTWEIFVPVLWQFEVGNFLGRECRQSAEEKMTLLLDLGIRDVALSRAMNKECFQWMRDHGVTFYDAAYLAVAYETDSTLVTADGAFVRKMAGLSKISLLKDLDLK